MEKVTGILIAGGKSARMKKDKALIDFNGKPMAQWAANLLGDICEKVLVASNKEEHKVFGDVLVKDKIGDGPIAGLYAGLLKSDSDWNLVLPCDSPKLSKSVINELLKNKEGFDAVVAKDSNGKVHTLIGLYNRRILDLIKEEIGNQRFSLMNVLDKINVNLIDFDSVEEFKNINIQEDLG